MGRTIYEVVSDIQAKKEQFNIVPPYATFQQIKAEMGGVDDGTLQAMLEAEVMNGTIFQRRTINGYSYGVSEE